MEDTRFVWVSFYEELITSLLEYKNKPGLQVETGIKDRN